MHERVVNIETRTPIVCSPGSEEVALASGGRYSHRCVRFVSLLCGPILTTAHFTYVHGIRLDSPLENRDILSPPEAFVNVNGHAHWYASIVTSFYSHTVRTHARIAYL